MAANTGQRFSQKVPRYSPASARTIPVDTQHIACTLLQHQLSDWLFTVEQHMYSHCAFHHRGMGRYNSGRRSRSRSLGRYSPGRYSPGRYSPNTRGGSPGRGSPGYSSGGSRSRSRSFSRGRSGSPLPSPRRRRSPGPTGPPARFVARACICLQAPAHLLLRNLLHSCSCPYIMSAQSAGGSTWRASNFKLLQ